MRFTESISFNDELEGSGVIVAADQGMVAVTPFDTVPEKRWRSIQVGTPTSHTVPVQCFLNSLLAATTKNESVRFSRCVRGRHGSNGYRACPMLPKSDVRLDRRATVALAPNKAIRRAF
jgi:hypothetical protein